MATLLLSKTFINLVPVGEENVVSGWRDASESDGRASVGAIRQYAGGRQRGVTQVGVASSWSFTLRGILGTDTDKLAAWLGQTVLVRDNRGRRMYGVLFAVPRTPWKEQLDLYDVEVSLNGVDVVEDV
jgi:hypothetical protein